MTCKNSAEDERIYRRAKKDIASLVQYVFKELEDFSSLYDYEPSWVFDQFQTEFRKQKAER